MTYKTIMVCLSTTDNAERLTRSACAVARKFDAHLIGIHTQQALMIYPGVAIHVPRDVAQTFSDHQSKETAAIRETFEGITRNEDFVSEWREPKANAAEAGPRLVEHARCADLVIMGQPDSEHDRPDQRRIQREVIEQSGRPVLVIPITKHFETFGEKVLIGWSATREATRAVHDALPFMGAGSVARLLWVSQSDYQHASLSDSAHELARTLDRHGVDTVVDHWANPEITIGDVLLNEAFETGSDMIVTGAYGHSAFYDFVIGATTTHLMKHMTVPVLFSN